MKRIVGLLLFCLVSASALGEVKTKEINYEVDGKQFTGYLAYDDSISGKRPGILVLHEWWGHNVYARKCAEMLAGLGYTAFALDMYGTGNVAQHPEDAKKFMQAVMSDMPQAQKRFKAAQDILLSQPTVDAKKTAAIGYCMGGGLALNMARAGADMKGFVVFHGSLGTQSPVKAGQIKGKILVLNGADDPFVPAEQVQLFEKEMKDAGVAYELKSYPGAKHSFTNPEADKYGKEFNMPLAYNEAADKESWQQMQGFFKDIFK